MLTSIYLKSTYSSRGKDFYIPVLCRYKFLEFQMIVSKIGIIHLSFSNEIHLHALQKIKQFMPAPDLSWPNIKITPLKKLVQEILANGHDKPIPDFKNNPFLNRGTPFQQKIWQAIWNIKSGEKTTYGELAAAVGSLNGARAAGQACKQNPLALIIPCHRVVAANGLGGFAGDLEIKRKLLEIEEKTGVLQKVQLNDLECFTVKQ